MTCEAHEISTLLPLVMVIIKVKEAEKKTEKDRALVKEGCNQIRWLQKDADKDIIYMKDCDKGVDDREKCST